MCIFHACAFTPPAVASRHTCFTYSYKSCNNANRPHTHELAPTGTIQLHASLMCTYIIFGHAYTHLLTCIVEAIIDAIVPPSPWPPIAQNSMLLRAVIAAMAAPITSSRLAPLASSTRTYYMTNVHESRQCNQLSGVLRVMVKYNDVQRITTMRHQTKATVVLT